MFVVVLVCHMYVSISIIVPWSSRVSYRSSPDTYNRRLLHQAQDGLSQTNCMDLQVATRAQACKILERINRLQTERWPREVSYRILRFSSARYLSPSLHT